MSTKEELLEQVEELDEILDAVRNILDDPDLTPFQRLKEIEAAIAEAEEEEDEVGDE